MPFAVMGINVVKVAWWSQLALDNPGVKRIYRHHPNSSDLGLTKWMDDPEGAALDFAAFLVGHLSGVLDYIDLIAGDNEFILGPDHESPDRIDKADQFMAAFVQEADLLLGKGVCVGNFNVGHWGPETVDYFPHTLAAIQAQALQGERLSYFCFHEYYWPLLRDDEHWYTGKFLQAMPPILERYPDVPCIITEVGIDKAACVWGEGHAGWRKTHDDINIAIEGYCGDHGLAWYNDLLNQTDYVAAALIFGCGMGGWRGMGFDIMNDVDDVAILDRIKMYPVVAPPEPPTNGGESMPIRVFDMNNVEQNEQWAKDKYGVAWRRCDAAVGQKVYRLVELREKTGNHSLVTKVIDEDGNPIAELPITFYWSDAPWPPDPPTEVYAHDWYDRFVWGLTKENGDVGPGMGTGAYHGWGEGGPHAVWIHDAEIPSDICEKLGMMAGTFHDHLDQVFQLAVEEEPPEPDGDLLAEVRRIRVATESILKHLTGQPPEPKLEVFHAKYFPNMDLSGEPVLTQEEDKIDHFWGAGSPGIPVPADYFSARWVGEFTFEEGTYEFTVLVDDGFRLWVDGMSVIEIWKAQPPTEYKATVTFFSAGKRPVCAEYYEQAGGATCRLEWKKL